MEINRLIDTKKLLFESLDKSFEIYNNQLQLCKENFSEVNVHDLRVCIRRFMSRLSMLKNIIPGLMESNYKQVLKPKLKIFNGLRDTQVQVLRVQSWVYQMPALYKYFHHLINLEESYIASLKQKIEEFNNEDIEILINQFKEELNLFYTYRRISYADIFNHVKSELNEVLRKFKSSSKDKLSSIHKVRISFKKFRYSLEIVQPIINLYPEELAELKAFQTTMGNLQDNSVFHEKFNEYYRQFNEISKDDYNEIENKIIMEQEQIIDTFFDNFDKIHSFWKNEYNNV